MSHEPDPLAQHREAALRQRIGDYAREYDLTRIEDLWELDACLRGVSRRFSVSEHQIAAYRALLGLKAVKPAEHPMQPTLDL